MQEVPEMPNRTIYVADADLPIFERAQQLAGGNLSATIAEALRRFVESQEARAAGFEEVTVKVGKMVRTYKRFRGRLLAKGRTRSQDETRDIAYSVYLTQREKFAVYIRDMPNWSYWSSPRAWFGANWDIDVDIDVDACSPDTRKQRKAAKRAARDYGWAYKSRAFNDWWDWPSSDYDYRLEVFDKLEELQGNVPQELYEAVVQAVNGGPENVEFLDI